MKSKCNLFGLLSRGVTATHPLCSVFILSFLFVFLFFNVSVFASGSPSNLPYSDSWQFGQALDAYESLTLEQQKISDFLVGCQGNAYAGLSNYNLQNSYSSFNDVVNSVSMFGKKIWDNMTDAYKRGYEIGSGIRNKLSNFLGSTVDYASKINMSFSAWLGNIGVEAGGSASFRIGYYPDSTKDYINYFGDESLYEWQFYPQSFNNFVWDYVNISDSVSVSSVKYNQFYDSNLANYSSVIKVNNNYNSEYRLRNCYLFNNVFNDYNIVFLNTSNNTASLVDSSGNSFTSQYANVIGYVPSYSDAFNYNYYFECLTYSFSPSDSLVSIAAYIFNHMNVLARFYAFSSGYSVDSSLFTVLVGNSFDTAVVLRADGNLNFAPVSNYVTVYAPNQPIYLDIVGFINDIYDNTKTIKKSVEDNTVISDGTPIDANIWDTISNYFTRPDSGLHIGIDFFKLPDGTSPLFDTYIADLWRNTKDMVLYCGDILKVFTLNGGGGLAYVVYGAIGVGVIGGVFSKFLL